MDQRHRIGIFALAAFATASCGGDNGESTDSSRLGTTETGLVGNSISKYGVVSAELTHSENDSASLKSKFFASFLSFDDPLPNSLLLELENSLGLNGPNCEVYRWGIGIEDEEDIPPHQFVSAGQSLIVSNLSGTWAELNSKLFEGVGSFYQTEPVIINGWPGNDATIDIPGAEFPAFKDIPLVFAQPITDMILEVTNIQLK